MPRLYGVKERLDKIIYDTHPVSRQTDAHFFGNANIGTLSKTNLRVGGQMPGGETAVVFSIGMRLLGLSTPEEDEILDYLTLIFTLGDRPVAEIPGNLLSTQRFILKGLAKELDDGWQGRPLVKPENMPHSPGYNLKRPIIIPVRQCFGARIHAANEISRPVDCRVMLFTLSTRDVV